MKTLITTCLLLLASFALQAQRALFVEFEIELPNNVETEYEDIRVFVTYDEKSQRTFDVGKKGKIGFNCVPQTDYQIAFVCPGYVTKTVAVNLEELTFNMPRRVMRKNYYTIVMEPREKDGDFKLDD